MRKVELNSLFQFCLTFSLIYLEEMKNYYSLSVSCTASQLIMRVRKPKVAFKLSCTGKTQGSTLTYYCPRRDFANPEEAL